ncbi:Ferric uptake regulation protein [Brucella abortus S19]|nr:Ferric uptake regulation protein [Brucella abortus S19]
MGVPIISPSSRNRRAQKAFGEIGFFQLQKIATDGDAVHNRSMNKPYTKPDYEQELRRAGVRITRPRRIILNILNETEDHPDALEIFRRAVEEDDSISLSTVYRTMKLLEERGAIHRHAFAGGPSRFEQASGAHHDHIIDMDSGDVVEFHSDKIEKLQEEIARSLGFEIVHHRLELYCKKLKS